VLLLHATVAPVCSTKRSRLAAAVVLIAVTTCVLIPPFSIVVLERQRKAAERRNKLRCYMRQRSWSADLTRAVSRAMFHAGRAAGFLCTSTRLGGRRQLPLPQRPSRKRRRGYRRRDVPWLLPQRAGRLLMSVMLSHPATRSSAAWRMYLPPRRLRTTSRARTADHVTTTAEAVCETRFPARSIVAARAHAGLPVGRGAHEAQRQRSRSLQEGGRRRLVPTCAGSARGALVAVPRAAAPTIDRASGWTESATWTLVCPVGHTGTRSLG